MSRPVPVQMLPVRYAPSADTFWSRNPGALSAANGFFPTKRGTLATVANAAYFAPAITDIGIQHARMVRRVDGTVRFLVFGQTSIDEYNSAGTRTSVGTGFTSGTRWSVTTFGNDVIATNFGNVPLVSSSAGVAFAALAGSPPRARYVCTQLGFVVLANTSNFGDEVYWSALNDDTNFVNEIRTQSGKDRLVDTPGDITGIATLRDSVVVFKADSIYVGDFSGPYIWEFRVASNRVGCIAPESIIEFNGKLYFVHSSGVQEFDGQNVRDISGDVWSAFLSATAYVTRSFGATIGGGSGSSPGDLAFTVATIDDIEGNVIFGLYCTGTDSGVYRVLLAFNVWTQRWGVHGLTLDNQILTIQADMALPVRASTSDIQTFLKSANARALLILTDKLGTYGGTATPHLHYIGYPIAGPCSLTLGVQGQRGVTRSLTKAYVRTIGTPALPSITARTYNAESKAGGALTTAAGTANSELQAVDVANNEGMFHEIDYAWTSAAVELAEVGQEWDVEGDR